jgi:hypothetical protein
MSNDFERSLDPLMAARGLLVPSDIELQVELAIREAYVSNCPICKGIGGGACQCIQYFALASKYHRAGVPRRYWSIPESDWRGDPEAFAEIKQYLAHIQEFKQGGIGYILMPADQNSVGTGKTLLLCWTLMGILQAGFTARYYPMTSLLDDIMRSFGDHAFGERQRIVFERIEFLALDDVGREFYGTDNRHGPMVRNRLESILRTRSSAGLITLIATTLSPDDFHERYKDGALSVVAGNMHAIQLRGVDERRHGAAQVGHAWDRIVGGGSL